MKRPAELFTRSQRPMPSALPELSYPLHDDVLVVSRHGQICIAGLGAVRVTTALAGYEVGIREEADGRLLVTFVDLDLGHIEGNRTVTPMNLNSEKRAV